MFCHFSGFPLINQAGFTNHGWSLRWIPSTNLPIRLVALNPTPRIRNHQKHRVKVRNERYHQIKDFLVPSLWTDDVVQLPLGWHPTKLLLPRLPIQMDLKWNMDHESSDLQKRQQSKIKIKFVAKYYIYMYMYIHMYIYTYVYIHTYVYTY